MLSDTSCYNSLKSVVLDGKFSFVCDAEKHNRMRQNNKGHFTLKMDFDVHVSGVCDCFVWPS
jgi:hypothetical protein